MRLEHRFRTFLYIVVAVLFGTGTAWFAIDRLRGAPSSEQAWEETSTYLLMLHGGAAMVFLLLLGALVALHVGVTWRRGNNRVSGVVMLATNAVLVMTAFGLYYAGSEMLRRWTSDLHIAIGLGFPLLLLLHVILGKRSRSLARQEAATRAAHLPEDLDRSPERRAVAIR